jgi:hypothetical protein
MIGPRSLDADAKERPTRRCPECGQVVRILHPRLEHIRMYGRRLFAEGTAVNHCGHRQEWALVPDRGLEVARLVSMVGRGGVRVVAALLLAILMLAACSITPEQRELIQRTWAERERERAQECARIRCGQGAP